MEHKINVTLSVEHLPADNLWRKTIEKAVANNFTFIEFAHELSVQRGSQYLYIPSENYYYSKKQKSIYPLKCHSPQKVE